MGWLDLFGNNKRKGRNTTASENQGESVFSDSDYEFLFTQLLEGVANGWHQGKIVKFFEQLGEQGKQQYWVAWLERFGQKMLNSSNPNSQLATKMLKLGQLTTAITSVEKIGQASVSVAQLLLNKNKGNPIWEYTGPDNPELISDNQPEKQPPPTEEGNTTMTLQELLDKLEQDADLVAQLSSQLGINTNNPQEIVKALFEQFNQQLNNDIIDRDWVTRGLELAQSGDLAGAIICWDKAIELNPNLFPAWHNRGSALNLLQRWSEAIASFDKALAIDPHNYITWLERGNSFYNLQSIPEALACWDQVIKLNPDNYQAWYNRGCALETLSNIQEALASYDNALKIKPDFAEAQERKMNLEDNKN